jgi:biopolymer transport protein TolR
MKTTRRMKRMTRSKARKMPGFNLVSLMDIFTILVFFLLVNSADTQDLPSPEQVKLPESVSEKKPEETAVVMITDTEILVQNKLVALRSDVETSKNIYVPAVRDELLLVTQRAVGITSKAKTAKKEVTIMGDRAIPFKLLKKIMSSCTAAGYETINLAVIQKASQNKKDKS